MIARVRSWLNATPGENSFERRLAVLLQVTLLINLPGSSLFLLNAWIARATLLGAITLAAALLSLLLQISTLVAVRRGRFRLAVGFSVLALTLPLFIAFWPRGIVNSRAIFLNFALPIVFVAVYAHKRRWLALTTALMFGVIVVVGLLEKLNPPLAGFVPFRGDIFSSAVISAFPTFIILAWLLDSYGRTFRDALREAHAREQELAQVNAALRAEIAERVAAERRRAESEARLRMIVDQLPAILWTTDCDLHFTSLAGAGLTALDLRPDEVVGLTLAEFFNMSGPSTELLVAHQRALDAETVTYEDSWRNHTYQVHIEPLRDGQDQIVGAIGLALDVSERKRLEAQLLQSQKMEAIGLLAGGVAHDFNNMLTAISGYTELALDNISSDHGAAVELQEIRKATDRAAGLTRQLLAFARKQIIDPRVLNLNDVVVDLDKLLRRLISADIELVLAADPDLWPVRVDHGQIEQILINLVVNARDAMPEGGKLTIATANVLLDDTFARAHAGARPGAYVVLVVSDTGVGMSPEVQARVFEPFFTTKGLGRGTGLGLATVYGIVKQHGGYIKVESQIGQGTAINIYLPRVAAPLDDLPLQDEPETLPRGSETVLVVEDDPAVRDLAARMLRAQGYTALEAPNGEDALRMASEYRGVIHLLLADVVMPQLGGRVLAARLASMRPGIKVLFTSGYTDNSIVEDGQLDRGVAFLQKPFTSRQLARKVRVVLDGATT